MVNVLTGFQYQWQNILALILAFLALLFFSYFVQTKANAQKQYIKRKGKKKTDQLTSDIYEQIYEKGPLPRHATISLYCGLLCLLISVYLVILANVRGGKADEKRHQEHILILETAKEEICRQLSEQSDSLRDQLLKQSDALREQILKQSETIQKQHKLQLSGKPSAQIDINSNDAP